MIKEYPTKVPVGSATEETLSLTFIDSTDTTAILNEILKELKMMNLHLASMTGERFTMNDLGD